MSEINADEIFAQFGLDTPATTIQVDQNVGSIQVGNSFQDIEAEEVAPNLLDAPVLTARTVEIIDEVLETIGEVSNEEPSVDTTFVVTPNPKEIVKEVSSRFSGATWYEEIQKANIILAGLGGIGSYVAFLLSRMQPAAIFLYDDDSVETVNLSGQLYGISHVGMSKVSAISSLIKDLSNYNTVFSCKQKFTETTEAGDIMICGFDNMLARKVFFTSWLEHVRNKPEEERNKCLFIDGRLSAEELQVYCLTGNDTYNIIRYKQEFLFSDSEADETVCSYKQTTYCANLIGSIIVNLFTNFIANKLNPVIPRGLPFITYYDASLMYFKTTD